MQSDHTTIFEIGEQADDLMTEMAAAGFHGMSNAQADIVVRMGRLLDRAAKAIGSFEKTKTGQSLNPYIRRERLLHLPWRERATRYLGIAT